MTKGTELIVAERDRQISAEGWTAEHDTQHVGEELAMAAVCYALPAQNREMTFQTQWAPFVMSFWKWFWPWDMKWWKPTPEDRIRELTKAGALCAAEIDRLIALQEEDAHRQIAEENHT